MAGSDGGGVKNRRAAEFLYASPVPVTTPSQKHLPESTAMRDAFSRKLQERLGKRRDLA